MKGKRNIYDTENTLPYLTPSEREDLKLFYSYDDSECLEAIRKERRRRAFAKVIPAVRYAAVAAFFAFCAWGVWYFYDSTRKLDLSNAMAGTTKAVLELASGEKLELGRMDDAEATEILDACHVKIGRRSDFITYDLADLKYDTDIIGEEEMTINKIVTPLGGEYKVILSDGTQVWLNAGSELIYPTRFSGKSRAVHLTGEAFFDVTKGETPFEVRTSHAVVKVLGTRFDVSAYPDDSRTQVVLERGRVDVRTANENYSLVPNDRFVIDNETLGVRIDSVDASGYGAWTQGEFVFQNEPIASIAKKLTRWYNVPFVAEEGLDKNFSGHIRKYRSVDDMIRMLEMTGELRFVICKDEVCIISQQAGRK